MRTACCVFVQVLLNLYVTIFGCFFFRFLCFHLCIGAVRKDEEEGVWCQAFQSRQWSSVLTQFCYFTEVMVAQHKSELSNWINRIVSFKDAACPATFWVAEALLATCKRSFQDCVNSLLYVLGTAQPCQDWAFCAQFWYFSVPSHRLWHAHTQKLSPRQRLCVKLFCKVNWPYGRTQHHKMARADAFTQVDAFTHFALVRVEYSAHLQKWCHLDKRLPHTHRFEKNYQCK